MSTRSWFRALQGSLGHYSCLRQDIRPDRRRADLVVEPLEGRMLLAGSSSPTNPVPISPSPAGAPTPQQLGAAYHQVVAIQARTLDALSAAHRHLYAAFDQLAARANPAVARDRRILQEGAVITSRAEQGLVVARGVEEQSANTNKAYIPNHLFTTLGGLVEQAQITGSNLARSARRSTDAVVHKLNVLDAELAAPRD